MSKDQDRNERSARHTFVAVLFAFGGSLLLFGFLLFTEYARTTESTGMLWWQEIRDVPMSERVPHLQGAIALWVVAAILGAVAIWLTATTPERKLNKLKRYVPILKGVEHMPIQQIASITNSNPSVVFRDIQIMIDSGMIEDLYIDYQAARVVNKKYTPEQSYKTVAKCPSCGANTEVIVGITRGCAYCGQPLVL